VAAAQTVVAARGVVHDLLLPELVVLQVVLLCILLVLLDYVVEQDFNLFACFVLGFFLLAAHTEVQCLRVLLFVDLLVA